MEGSARNMDEFDPWRDTDAERGEERDDTFDDGSVSEPFGPLSEVLGIPRQVPGFRSRRGFKTSVRSRMLALILVVTFVALAGWTILSRVL